MRTRRTAALGMRPLVIATGIALAALSAPVAAQKAPENAATTTTIQHDSEAARSLRANEPTYQTREERLKAKPLDWKATSGKPTKPRPLTAAEKKALTQAKPATSEGGAPDPKAEEEARRLHPEEWK